MKLLLVVAVCVLVGSVAEEAALMNLMKALPPKRREGVATAEETPV